MQYPIIDLIADAYLNNGWTGLDINSTNLINYPPIGFSSVVNGITFTRLDDGIYLNGTTINEQWTYVDYFVPLPFYGLNVGDTIYVSSDIRIAIIFYNGDTSVGTVDASPQYQPINSAQIPNGTNRIRIVLYAYDGRTPPGTDIDTIGHYAVGFSNNINMYDNFNLISDFPNRLKLPLPHYFPHPVIDALQRAAAGTQTADDTEILRHYLTPLGIGGI